MLKQLKKNILCSRCWNYSTALADRAYTYSLRAILLAEYKMILMDQLRRKKKK